MSPEVRAALTRAEILASRAGSEYSSWGICGLLGVVGNLLAVTEI